MTSRTNSMVQLLAELGFEPVAAAEVRRVQESIEAEVVKPVSERLPEKQEELEEARTWYVG